MPSEDDKIWFPKQLPGHLTRRSRWGQFSSTNLDIGRWLLRVTLRNPPAASAALPELSLAVKQWNAFFQAGKELPAITLHKCEPSMSPGCKTRHTLSQRAWWTESHSQPSEKQETCLQCPHPIFYCIIRQVFEIPLTKTESWTAASTLPNSLPQSYTFSVYPCSWFSSWCLIFFVQREKLAEQSHHLRLSGPLGRRSFFPLEKEYWPELWAWLRIQSKSKLWFLPGLKFQTETGELSLFHQQINPTDYHNS